MRTLGIVLVVLGCGFIFLYIPTGITFFLVIGGILAAASVIVNTSIKPTADDFYYYMEENGPTDYKTIEALEDKVKNMWEEKNPPVDSISIVHEVGHRYQCFLTSAGVKYTLEVIANETNVHFRIED